MNELTLSEKRTAKRASVNIENREKISITGVKQVDTFDDSEVSARLESSGISVYGQSLHISRLDLDNGILIIDGFISGVEYSDNDSRSGFLSRLFK